MPTNDPVDVLLAHDEWATSQILVACQKLTAEQFHQRFEMGPGSLHDTIVHMLGAMRTWTETLAGRDPTPRLEQGRKRSIVEIQALLEFCAQELAAEAKRLP